MGENDHQINDDDGVIDVEMHLFMRPRKEPPNKTKMSNSQKIQFFCQIN